jgi:hypothetical protein
MGEFGGKMRMEPMLEPLPLAPRAAWRMARELARAEGRGPLSVAECLDRTRSLLHARGLGHEEAASSALLLLALGLRERGADHSRVTERLRTHGEAAAVRAAFESARIVRAERPDLDPDRQAAFRRRAAVILFLAFAAWGAAGVHLLGRLG